jgi:hypothetical protein
MSASLWNPGSPLPAGLDAFRVGYEHPQSNNVIRTVGARLSEVYNVKDFGAKGDGVADDTAAIQAALDLLGPGVCLNFHGGTYRISAALHLPLRSAWLIYGQRAKILQTISNTPIFVFTHPGGVNDFNRDWSVRDFLFDWLVPQTAAESKSIAIAFDFLGPDRGAGFFNFQVGQCTITNGYRFLSIHPDTVARNAAAIVWGFDIEDIYSRSTGATIWLNSPGGAGGSPRCNYSNIYISDSNSGTIQPEPRFYISLQSSVNIKNLEFNVLSRFDCALIESCTSVSIDNARFEIVTHETNNSAMFRFSGSTTRAEVRNTEVQTINVNVASTAVLFDATGGARVLVRNITVRDVVTTSGAFLLLRSSASKISFSGDLYYDNVGTTYLHNVSGAFTNLWLEGLEVYTFYYNNVAPSLAATPMQANGEIQRYLITGPCWLVGVVTHVDKAITAGSITVRPRKSFNNIAGTGFALTTGVSGYRNIAPLNDASALANHGMQAGESLSVTVESSADLSPGTNIDIVVQVLVWRG